jgi:hypothetical protein
MKVVIKLKDKSNGCISDEVSIEELIFNQSDIEFQFPDYVDEYSDEPFEASLPYKDFLFFQDDYEVIVKIKNEERC